MGPGRDVCLDGQQADEGDFEEEELSSDSSDDESLAEDEPGAVSPAGDADTDADDFEEEELDSSDDEEENEKTGEISSQAEAPPAPATIAAPAAPADRSTGTTTTALAATAPGDTVLVLDGKTLVWSFEQDRQIMVAGLSGTTGDGWKEVAAQLSQDGAPRTADEVSARFRQLFAKFQQASAASQS